MIVPMIKVLVVGPKPLLADVIATVQRVGRVHLARTQGPQGGIAAGQLSPDEAAQKQLLERVHAEIEGLLSLLSFRGAAAPAAAVDGWEAAAADVARRTAEARELIKQRLELEDELGLVRSYHLAFEALAPLLARLERSARIKAFGFISKGGDTSVVEPLRLALKKLTGGRCEIYSRLLADDRVATLVAYHVNDGDKVRAFFTKAGINELRLPNAMAGLPMADAVAQLQQKLHELPAQIKAAQAQLDQLARRDGPQLAGLKLQALDILGRFNARHQADESRFGFILQGYLPQRDLPRLKETLAAKHRDKVTVQALEIGHHEAATVPVILKNNPVTRPFELLLSLMNPPLYGTVDPTPFVALFFPLYFGFIIGDVGFGAVLAAAALFVMLKFKRSELARSIGIILLLCAAWTIAFGVLFGELFGDLGEHLHLIRPMAEGLNRMNKESLFVLLGMALGFGVIQIFTGYVIGIVNGVRHDDRHHILEPVAFMVGLVGLALTILGLMKLLPMALLVAGGVMVVASMGMLASLVGLAGPIELFGAVGNILSYARLFAIGLSAVYLAFAANMIAKVIGMSGHPAAVVTGVVVAAVLIHPLFFIVGMISPIAQPGRLQLVEFFTKFKYYDVNGKKYKPFQTLLQQEDRP
ncbi:MAG TPA: V-type ATPase 116kDa subunit family protein [Candidatus Edwardsbacteria bacterium]|nr:V-type ATPase 116kDa subunit family protein [Candidatus Edwardsbacteria bacterium]